MSVKISGKGAVVIPANIRKKYNLVPGSKIEIVDYSGIIAIVPIPDNLIESSVGKYKNLPSLKEELFKDNEDELRWENEGYVSNE